MIDDEEEPAPIGRQLQQHIGRELAQVAERDGWSAHSIAAEIGRSPRTVQRMLAGGVGWGWPTLAEALDVMGLELIAIPREE